MATPWQNLTEDLKWITLKVREHNWTKVKL